MVLRVPGESPAESLEGAAFLVKGGDVAGPQHVEACWEWSHASIRRIASICVRNSSQTHRVQYLPSLIGDALQRLCPFFMGEITPRCGPRKGYH